MLNLGFTMSFMNLAALKAAVVASLLVMYTYPIPVEAGRGWPEGRLARNPARAPHFPVDGFHGAHPPFHRGGFPDRHFPHEGRSAWSPHKAPHISGDGFHWAHPPFHSGGSPDQHFPHEGPAAWSPAKAPQTSGDGFPGAHPPSNPGSFLDRYFPHGHGHGPHGHSAESPSPPAPPAYFPAHGPSFLPHEGSD